MSAPFSISGYTFPSPATTTSTFSMPHDLLPGDTLVLFAERGGSSSSINGVDALTPAQGAHSGLQKLANAARASTHDLAMVAVRITQAVPAGTTWTVLQTNGVNRRIGIAAAWRDIPDPPSYVDTTGLSADDIAGGTSSGNNGNGTSASFSLTTSVDTAYTFAAVAIGGNMVAGEAAGWTTIDQRKTVVNTGDRGVVAMYREETVRGEKSLTVPFSVTGSWAGVMVSVRRSLILPSTPAFKEWNGSSWVELVAKEWNGTSWVPLQSKVL